MKLKEKTIEIARISKLVADFKNKRNEKQSQLEKELKQYRAESTLLLHSLIESECLKAGIKTDVIDKIVNKWK